MSGVSRFSHIPFPLVCDRPLAGLPCLMVIFSYYRIWDALGFTRAGLIPRAGRLRRADGNGEEWVDAIVFYKSFVPEEEWGAVNRVTAPQ